MASVIITASIGKEHYKTDLTYRDLSFVADEQKDNGGEGLGPDPSGLIAAALASCTAITLRMYADRKGYNVARIDVEIELTRKDVSGITHTLFDRKIKMTGDITGDERQRLLAIADKCPTHKILTGEIVIMTTIR